MFHRFLFSFSLSFRIEDADDDLIFTINEDGRYEAKAIPPQVGMKAGDIVEGFMKGSSSSKKMVLLRPETAKTGVDLSLRQLAKKHDINVNQDTLILEKKARYCTHLCKLDTKQYGLPQTRQRKVCSRCQIFVTQ